jgi:outer membrane protease
MTRGFLMDTTAVLSQSEGFGADPVWAIKTCLILARIGVTQISGSDNMNDGDWDDSP